MTGLRAPGCRRSRGTRRRPSDRATERGSLVPFTRRSAGMHVLDEGVGSQSARACIRASLIDAGNCVIRRRRLTARTALHRLQRKTGASDGSMTALRRRGPAITGEDEMISHSTAAQSRLSHASSRFRTRLTRKRSARLRSGVSQGPSNTSRKIWRHGLCPATAVRRYSRKSASPAAVPQCDRSPGSGSRPPAPRHRARRQPEPGRAEAGWRRRRRRFPPAAREGSGRPSS